MSYYFRQRRLQKEYDPNQPRDEGGRWTTGGGGAGESGMAGSKSKQGGFIDMGSLPQILSDSLTRVGAVIASMNGAVMAIGRQPGVPEKNGKEQLIKEAQAALPAYKEMAGQLAANFGADTLDGPGAFEETLRRCAEGEIDKPIMLIASIKGGPRVDEKAEAAYGGDYGRLKDMVRGTLIVQSPEQLDDALDQLSAMGVRLGSKVKDRINGPDGTAYRDIKLNPVMPNGHVAELQILTPNMFHAKNTAGHKLYEEVRELAERVDRGYAATREERARLDENTRRQHDEVYVPAWNKDLQIAIRRAGL
jgi:hypothetical protein